MVLGKPDIYMQKTEIYPPLSSCTKKLNSMWIKDLNVEPEMKLLEEKIEKAF
jgi:hypothetical protein